MSPRGVVYDGYHLGVKASEEESVGLQTGRNASVRHKCFSEEGEEVTEAGCRVACLFIPD